MSQAQKHLLAFLKDWLAWAKYEACESKEPLKKAEVNYRKDRGLCWAARNYAYALDLPSYIIFLDATRAS